MNQQLYVTTQGPVKWNARITAGKVYEASQRAVGLRYQIVDDSGLSMAICIPRCQLDGCFDWAFCDQHGNPVAAPWEVERMESAEEMAAIYPEPIDYRAHAERLAEALGRADTTFASLGFLKTSPARFHIIETIAAYNQAKGEA